MKVLNVKIILAVALGSLLVACGGGTLNVNTNPPLQDQTDQKKTDQDKTDQDKANKPSSSVFHGQPFVVKDNKSVTDKKAQEWLKQKQFQNVDSICKKGGNCTNAYQLLNFHKAYAYGLSGKGQKIAVMDTYFNVNQQSNGIHLSFNSDDKIEVFGTLNEAFAVYNDKEKKKEAEYHGNFVASIAAGNYYKEYNGDVIPMGAAYNAKLHIADYKGPNGINNHLTQWTAATNDATKSGAIALNNSWGYDDSLKDAQSKFKQGQYNSYTDYAAEFLTSNGMKNISGKTVKDYIDALDNFQKQGVIVWALSNERPHIDQKTGEKKGLDDADISAGLPVLFPQLAEAWISVGNIEFVGNQSIANSKVGQLIPGKDGKFTFSQGDNIYQLSAPCGQTAEFCVVADGHSLSGAAYKLDQDNHKLGKKKGSYYVSGIGGTSFAAPQVSAALALLKEAFPNLTPEQLRNRLLASSNNSFFTNEITDGKYGIKDFGNGFTHKYSFKWGHGIPDVEAGLNEIGKSVIRIGDNLNNSRAFAFNDANLSVNKALFDAVINSLEKENIIYYDALYGEFSRPYTELIKLQNNPHKATLAKRIEDLNTYDAQNNSLSLIKQGISFTFDQPSLPLQRLFTGYNPIDMPDIAYLNPNAAEAAVNGSINFADGHLLYGFSKSIDSSIHNVGQNQSLRLAYSSNPSYQTRSAILAGLSMEQGSLLNSIGTGAWSIDQKQAQTSYMAITGEHDLSSDMSLKMMAALGETKMDASTDSLFGGADGIVTNYIDVQLNKQQTFRKDDLLTLKLSQPLRAHAGQMTVIIPQGADADGNLFHKQKTISLKPSGQQLDFGVNYYTDINSQMTLGLNGLYTKQANHIKDSPDHYSMTMTMAWDKIKFGLRGEQFEAGDLKQSAQLSFGSQF